MMWVYGFEKIKTIGDAYLAAGGKTASGEDHVAGGIELGLAMLDRVASLSHPVALRVGIHVGPVVAGVIGSHKFSYDIWGDTVNLAGRMESHGSPGGVHVSEGVRNRLESRFDFEARGEIDIKNHSRMRTFFVNRAADRPDGPDCSRSRLARAHTPSG